MVSKSVRSFHKGQKWPIKFKSRPKKAAYIPSHETARLTFQPKLLYTGELTQSQ